MTLRTVLVGPSVIRCAAPHPDSWNVRFAGKLHNARLSPDLPFLCKLTGRTWRTNDRNAPDRIPGYIYGECKCGAVTEYEVVAPPEDEKEAGETADISPRRVIAFPQRRAG